MEIDVTEINGVTTIIANGKGISLFNDIGIKRVKLTGWVWELTKGTSLPYGLKVLKDNPRTGHHTLSPTHNMPLSQYIGLLEQVAMHCQRVYKKTV